MSGTNTTDAGNGFAYLDVTSRLGSELVDLLLCDRIVPGSQPSYEICKIIYTYHPLGAKMAEAPVNMAQSQEREISVAAGPEERLVEAFQREWKSIGVVGADTLIKNTMAQARVYGISSIGVGSRNGVTSGPLPLDKLHEQDLYFNVFDPLNTAGSLVLEQDPNSPDYQKPRAISVGGKVWHPSRTVVMMNESPIYIEFTNSAFGFVGRSVYQRALFPLKTFIQSMITDDMVIKKIGLLIWKAKGPTSVTDKRVLNFFGMKRQNLKSGVTGNVLTIGVDEEVESLNFQNLDGPYKITRENMLKNIATAAGMPAVMLEQEALVEGFGEGTEDAKQIARYVDRVRIEMNPLYAFFDTIVQRRAWSPEFYESLKQDYPDYKGKPYETAFYEWRNSFQALWPNLLSEPDSEKAKTEDVRFKAAVAVIEVLAPLLDPENKADAVDWLQGEINSRKLLFSTEMNLDIEALKEYEPPQPEGGEGGAKEPSQPKPFASTT